MWLRLRKIVSRGRSGVPNTFERMCRLRRTRRIALILVWVVAMSIVPSLGLAADGLAVSPEQREISIKQAVGETLRLAA